jgi:hypothetical protein
MKITQEPNTTQELSRTKQSESCNRST